MPACISCGKWYRSDYDGQDKGFCNDCTDEPRYGYTNKRMTNDYKELNFQDYTFKEVDYGTSD